MTVGSRVNPFYLMPRRMEGEKNWRVFLAAIFLSQNRDLIFLFTPPKTIAQLAQPYKWSVSVCVISPIPTVADAMHLKSENHPRKIGDDESLQRSHSWQGGWRGREGGLLLLLLLPPTPSLVQSSGPPLGLQASALSPLFSCLRFWLSLTRSVARPLALSTLFFFFFFPSPTLYPSPSGSRSLPGA